MHGWLIAGSLRAVEGGKTEWSDKGQRGYYDLEGKALTVRAHPVVQQRQGGESKVDDNPILERYTVVGADAAEDVPCMDKDLVLVLQTESEGQLVLFAGKKKDASKWRAALKYAVSKERVFPESGPGVQRWLSRMRKAIKAGRLTEQAITDMFEREPMAAERVLDNSQGGTMLHVAARCSAALVGGDFTPPEKKPPPAEGVEERDLDIFFEYSDSQPEEEEAAEEPPKPRSLFELIYDACPESAEAKDDLGQTPLHIMASTNARHWRPIRWLSQWCPSSAATPDSQGSLPLHALCKGYDSQKQESCDSSLLELAAAFPAAATAGDNKRRTPLHVLARYHGSLVAPLRLLAWSNKEAVNARTSDGWLPLHYVARYHGASRASLDFLVSMSPGSEAQRNDAGWTPIHHLCRYGTTAEVLSALLDTQAANITTPGGYTPLHLLCRYQGFDHDLIRACLDVSPLVATFATHEKLLPLHLICKFFANNSASLRALLALHPSGALATDAQGLIALQHVPEGRMGWGTKQLLEGVTLGQQDKLARSLMRDVREDLVGGGVSEMRRERGMNGDGGGVGGGDEKGGVGGDSALDGDEEGEWGRVRASASARRDEDSKVDQGAPRQRGGVRGGEEKKTETGRGKGTKSIRGGKKGGGGEEGGGGKEVRMMIKGGESSRSRSREQATPRARDAKPEESAARMAGTGPLDRAQLLRVAYASSAATALPIKAILDRVERRSKAMQRQKKSQEQVHRGGGHQIADDRDGGCEERGEGEERGEEPLNNRGAATEREEDKSHNLVHVSGGGTVVEEEARSRGGESMLGLPAFDSSTTHASISRHVRGQGADASCQTEVEEGDGVEGKVGEFEEGRRAEGAAQTDVVLGGGIGFGVAEGRARRSRRWWKMDGKGGDGGPARLSRRGEDGGKTREEWDRASARLRQAQGEIEVMRLKLEDREGTLRKEEAKLGQSLDEVASGLRVIAGVRSTRRGPSLPGWSRNTTSTMYGGKGDEPPLEMDEITRVRLRAAGVTVLAKEIRERSDGVRGSLKSTIASLRSTGRAFRGAPPPGAAQVDDDAENEAGRGGHAPFQREEGGGKGAWAHTMLAVGGMERMVRARRALEEVEAETVAHHASVHDIEGDESGSGLQSIRARRELDNLVHIPDEDLSGGKIGVNGDGDGAVSEGEWSLLDDVESIGSCDDGATLLT